MTTVSLMEYPIVIKMATMDVKLNSTRARVYKPKTHMASCTSAKTAQNP